MKFFALLKLISFSLLELYLDDFRLKSCHDTCEPEILKENASTAWVDGKNLLGPRVGKFCMNLCIKKAKESGLGMVTCKGIKIDFFS